MLTYISEGWLFHFMDTMVNITSGMLIFAGFKDFVELSPPAPFQNPWSIHPVHK